MKSALYFCRVMHRRVQPEYSFRHPIYMFLLDLDEVAASHSRLLAFNRAGLFSFRDSDHFRFAPGDSRSTREKVGAFLGERPEKIFLLTNLRVLGYTFNPVSFFFCEMQDGRTEVLVEVNNTYGEQKPFLVNAGTASLQQKNFYVSPFIRHDRSFYFSLQRPAASLRINISAVSAGGNLIMKGILTGRAAPLTARGLLTAFFRYPFVTLKIIALIHWHAFRLYMKGVPHFGKAETDQKLKELNHV